MLDLHATGGTPGATTTYTGLQTLIANDGQSAVGVPLRPDARLIMWGSGSLVANTIYGTQLRSQDSVDPINGELMRIGTASLKNLVYKTTNIPFKTGARIIGQSTNTAQTATSFGFTLDSYDSAENTVDGRGLRFAPGQLPITQTQGAADLVLSWYNTAVAPATAIPNGRYGILGVWATLSTGPHLVRFQHADFKGLYPGVPVVDSFGSAILGAQEGMLDILWANAGYQFVALSELSGKPCVPVFNVTSAGTGLGVQGLATVTTDTPYYIINLAKLE
jgi:hypothetical protein